MSGSAIGLSLGYGFEGTVAYTPDQIVQAYPVKSTSANIPFGRAVMKNTDSSVSLADATTTADNFAGIAVAEVKQGYAATVPGSLNQSGEYLPNAACDVLERGLISAVCQRGGAPNAGGTVYLRISTNGSYPTAVVGGFESSADGAHTVALTNCCWDNNRLDANNVGVIKLKYANT